MGSQALRSRGHQASPPPAGAQKEVERAWRKRGGCLESYRGHFWGDGEGSFLAEQRPRGRKEVVEAGEGRHRKPCGQVWDLDNRDVSGRF